MALPRSFRALCPCNAAHRVCFQGKRCGEAPEPRIADVIKRQACLNPPPPPISPHMCCRPQGRLQRAT